MSRGADWLRNQLGAPAPSTGPVVHRPGAPAPATRTGAAGFPAVMGGGGAQQYADPNMVPTTPDELMANPWGFINGVARGAQRLPGVHDTEANGLCPGCGSDTLFSMNARGGLNRNPNGAFPAPSCSTCGWPVVQYGSASGEGGMRA